MYILNELGQRAYKFHQQRTSIQTKL